MTEKAARGRPFHLHTLNYDYLRLLAFALRLLLSLLEFLVEPRDTLLA